MQITDCAVIILAAGSSSRLGKPKQLLLYKNKTLLQHAVDEAQAINAAGVVVVTGANKDEIVSKIKIKTAEFIYNPNWQQGMANSMQAGLSAVLSRNENISSVIIMLCDQPYVSSDLLHKMINKKHTSNKGIIACVYKETLGVPALFDKKYFNRLLSLQGDEGAKKIIMLHAEDVAAVPFEQGAVDIDTTEAYEQLTKENM